MSDTPSGSCQYLSLSRNSLPTLRVGNWINTCHNSASHRGLAQPLRCLSTQRIGIYISLLTPQPGYKCHMHYSWWMYQSFIINSHLTPSFSIRHCGNPIVGCVFIKTSTTTLLNKCFRRTRMTVTSGSRQHRSLGKTSVSTLSHTLLYVHLLVKYLYYTWITVIHFQLVANHSCIWQWKQLAKLHRIRNDYHLDHKAGFLPTNRQFFEHV